MDKIKIAALFYAVLTALKEAKTKSLGGVPNGHMYAQLMSEVSFEQWERFVNVLLKDGFATQENYLLKITEKGEKFQTELGNIYKSVKP